MQRRRYCTKCEYVFTTFESFQKERAQSKRKDDIEEQLNHVVLKLNSIILRINDL